ncbi:hypothetical protein [Streptomyces sp. NPDC005407]|uniref:hypothetical protein n=1 Tax=Streptomyces sp. NPDC005407 TaxID=3155340 RepID=UPI0033AA195E
MSRDRAGSRGYAVVTADVAGDPAQLAELRDKLHRQIAEHRAIDDELDGIARTSGLDTRGLCRVR